MRKENTKTQEIHRVHLMVFDILFVWGFSWSMVDIFSKSLMEETDLYHSQQAAIVNCFLFSGGTLGTLLILRVGFSL